MADVQALSREAEAARVLIETIALTGETDAQLVTDSIEGETDFFETLDALLLADLQDEAFEAALTEAKAVLDVRKGRIAARRQTRRAGIERAMLMLDQKKIERPGATLSLANRRPALEVVDEAEIPAEYWKAGKPTLDKKALAEALEAGRSVSGAHLSNGTQTLTVRRK